MVSGGARAGLHDSLICANCEAQLPPTARFCPQCGQETTRHAPTLAEFAHEFIGHFVAAEGTLWRTLRLLLTSPGRLTTEYFAGRRRRYVAPLRLYLSVSFVFFLVVKATLAAGALHFALGPLDQHGSPILRARDPVAFQRQFDDLQRCVDQPQQCGWYERSTSRFGLKVMRLSDHADSVGEHMVAMAPYAFIFLVPVLAAVLKLVYRSRRLALGAHFVFALHTYSFALLVLAIVMLLPSAFVPVAVLVILGYGLWSMHAVYGGRWAPALARLAIGSLLFSTALLLVEVVLSLVSVMLTQVA